MTGHVVTTEAELDALYGTPVEASLIKEVPGLTAPYRAFVEAAPFFALATVAAEGLDCSPRGDPAGFVRVLDDRTLAIPDRRGNNRIDSLRNLVRDPRLSLMFMVPGSQFRAIGRTRGFKVYGKQDGYVWVFWDTRKKFIQRATVMVAVDRIDGDLLEHVLLEELTQSLGPLGDTTILPESVMFQRGSDHGRAPKLSDWDCRMLKLLYGHLKPGDEEAEVREAYRQFWRTGLNAKPAKEKSSNTREERP